MLPHFCIRFNSCLHPLNLILGGKLLICILYLFYMFSLIFSSTLWVKFIFSFYQCGLYHLPNTIFFPLLLILFHLPLFLIASKCPCSSSKVFFFFFFTSCSSKLLRWSGLIKHCVLKFIWLVITFFHCIFFKRNC